MTRKLHNHSHSSISPKFEWSSKGECYRSQLAIRNKATKRFSLTHLPVAFFNHLVIHEQRGCNCGASTFRNKIAKVVAEISATAEGFVQRRQAKIADPNPIQSLFANRSDRAVLCVRAARANGRHALRSCSSTSLSSPFNRSPSSCADALALSVFGCVELVSHCRSVGCVRPFRNQSPVDLRSSCEPVQDLRRACGRPLACAFHRPSAHTCEHAGALVPGHACAWLVPPQFNAARLNPGRPTCGEPTGRVAQRVEWGPTVAHFHFTGHLTGSSIAARGQSTRDSMIARALRGPWRRPSADQNSPRRFVVSVRSCENHASNALGALSQYRWGLPKMMGGRK